MKRNPISLSNGEALVVDHPVMAARVAKLTLTMAAYEKEIYYVGDLAEIATGRGYCNAVR